MQSDMIDLYAVRNKEGKWFRAKGRDGYGDTWVDSLKKARIYTKIGPARATVSFFANGYPKFGCPDIVQLVVSEHKVLDESARVEKQKSKKEKAAAKRKERHAQWEYEQAKAGLDAAKARVESLRRTI